MMIREGFTTEKMPTLKLSSTPSTSNMLHIDEGFALRAMSSLACGHHIAVIFGGGTPFILNEVEHAHILIRDGYVHGLMHGEALGTDKFELQDINPL